jgi:hypothetical protein
MPSQVKPLNGDSFTKFLRDSAANSGKWPNWVRGDERSITFSPRSSGKDCVAGNVKEGPSPAGDSDEQ